MSIIFDFPQNWYSLFFAFLLSWLILLAYRRKHRRKEEVKEQLCLALTGLLALSFMEVFATSMDLWQYIPGNWPVILWPTYFVAVLFGYQLLRLVEETLSGNNN